MKKAIITLAAIVTAVLNAAPAMAGGMDQLAIFERSVHGRSFNYNKGPKKARRSASHNRSAQHRAATKKAAARRAYAQKVAARKAAAHKAQQQSQVAKNETKKSNASDWKAPVKISAIAGTNTLYLNRNQETDKVDAAETEVEKTETVELQPETTEVAELECKRYIPSAGMTITVPCGQ